MKQSYENVELENGLLIGNKKSKKLKYKFNLKE